MYGLFTTARFTVASVDLLEELVDRVEVSYFELQCASC
jgi:hypothetical protein